MHSRFALNARACSSARDRTPQRPATTRWKCECHRLYRRRRRMTQVYFRMLGPLLVESDGAPVAIGGARQRALLGLLLLHRGKALSRDRLLAELWGADDPSAAKRVHMAVARLRKALGPEVGPRLVTDAAGRYALVLGPDELDVIRFERLLSEGRASLAARDVAGASETLHDALALWRGNVLEDVAEVMPPQTEIVRLEELRLEALEECIDADLELGRHAELVPDLERLLEEHRSREHLLEQLMLALYRSGRQRDALAVYRRTSERLGDEFGLTPGPALRTLERAVLDHAPGLGASTEPEVAAPRQSTSGSLIGRDAAMRELAARITSDARLLTLLGPPGIGKTRLALTVADVVRHEYRDGVHVVPLASVREEAQVPEQIAERLGLARDGGGSVEHSVQAHLAGREALLVL